MSMLCSMHFEATCYGDEAFQRESKRSASWWCCAWLMICQWPDTWGSPKPRTASSNVTTGLGFLQRWPSIVNLARSAKRVSLDIQLGQRWNQCLWCPNPSVGSLWTLWDLCLAKRGNQFILTFCDYATRYPEAVALPSVEAPHVAKELMTIFSRLGVPEQTLTN